MLTDRVYRSARAPAAALRELRDLAGKQFCPRCVGALEQMVARDQSVLHADATREPVAVGA
jgi:HD-GYP domain-containing protein (c-di-GMP phosphodiesterase class II)